MENRKKNRRKASRQNKHGGFQKMFINVGGNPEDIEGQDWYLDSPDVRLTRIFSVVLVLHIIAVGGILAFKMINQTGSGSAIAQANIRPSETVGVQRELAGKVDRVRPTKNFEVVMTHPNQYRVIAGDTLSGIASKLDVSMDTLRIVNNINAPDEIIEGMTLEVPYGEQMPREVMDYDQLPEHPTMIQTSKADLMKEAPTQSMASGVVYQVQKGDTVWGIAKKFGVDQNQLMSLNGIERAEGLQANQMLSIPGR